MAVLRPNSEIIENYFNFPKFSIIAELGPSQANKDTFITAIKVSLIIGYDS